MNLHYHYLALMLLGCQRNDSVENTRVEFWIWLVIDSMSRLQIIVVEISFCMVGATLVGQNDFQMTKDKVVSILILIRL